MRKLIFLTLTVLMFLNTSASAATVEEAPAWLQAAATSKTGTFDKDVHAVVLRNDRAVTVNNDGRITTTTTYAVRILTREGREYAQAAEVYLTQSGKVREINAWMIRPTGSIKKYGKDQTADLIADPNDIYNEYRIR